MTSRERILAAINHKQPDQIPVDMGSTPSSGISSIAYSNLVKHIGRADLPVLIYDVVQQLAQPDDHIIDFFGVDVLDIGRTFNDKQSDWKPVTMANGAQAFYPKWFMDVETYRTLFKPRHNILCDYVKSHSKMHTFIHSCGSISLLMPDMIEAIRDFNKGLSK